MGKTQICRLCVSECSNFKPLFDDLEVYEITVRYFDPMFLNQNDLRVLCYDCWCHIADFHNFQQTVTVAQNKLIKKPKVMTKNETLPQNIHIKDEPQDHEMLTDSPDSAYDDMLLPELVFGDNEPMSGQMDMYEKNFSGEQCAFNTDKPSKTQKSKGSSKNATSKNCPGPVPIKCRFCPKISNNFASYRNHFCQKHSGKEFYVYCCGRKYQVRQQYESHLFLDRDFTYQCKACEKRFDLEITLIRHTRQCQRYKQGIVAKKGVQHFKCQQCSEVFLKENLLRQHVFNFHADRRHHCTLCEKSYTKRDSLREHMAKHTGNHLYKCDPCAQKFTYRSQWRKHMLKFHPKNSH